MASIALAHPAPSAEGTTLPQNVEAEAALLGAMMIDNRLADELIDRLQPDHFYEPVHGRIFGAIRTLLSMTRKGGKQPVLASGIEYMSRALNEGSDARDCRTAKLLDGYAPMVKRLYANDNKIQLNELNNAMETAPKRMSGLFPEGTEFTHGEEGSQ